MKRTLALVLTVCMLVLCAAPGALAQSAAPTSLTIGTVAELSGYFYTDLWGANTSDMDVRGLIHGYSTVAWESAGAYAVDATVVSSLTTGLNANGDKIYRFTLNDGLLWNNGQPVTAQDYLFTVLLRSSPELAGLGVNNAGYEHLVGWDAFSQNSGTAFSGVNLIDDHNFTLTVRGQYLPYFYELILVNVEPTPISVVAPGVSVVDDGAGAYLAADPGTVFSTNMLQQTLLGENGYVFAPSVTCGPYDLTSYDAQTHVAKFQKNPYYKGNYEGRLPEMETLTFQPVTNATMMDDLKSGKVDIINKVSDGAVIAQGLEMMNTETAHSVTYMRSGFSFLSFACEEETASQASVRKAVAMSIDVDALCNQVMNGYAMPVYGYYGLGQWMASQDTESLTALNRYGYDPMGAKSTLIDDGWTYNQDGGAFTEGQDEMRYKIVNDRLVPLELRVAMTKDSVAAENVSAQLTAAASALGAKITIDNLPFSELLSHYYRQTDRTYNVFLLGTNFSHVFDPYYVFNTADDFQGVTNTTGLRDEQLMTLAGDMRSVDSANLDEYLTKWFAFQERFSDLLPIVPLYSNVYFDFYRPDLYGYQINAHWGWSSAILYATFTAPEEDATVAVVETVTP